MLESVEHKGGSRWAGVKDRCKGLLIPPSRAYVRYLPIHAGKRRAWGRLINPYLQWHPHEFVARTLFGAKMAGNSTEILQQYVYYFGVWEPSLTRWIQERLSPGEVFVDVGANIGYFSLLGSKLVGESGTVVAVEPSPHAFSELLRNLRLNKTRNVRPINIAASNERERIRMYEGLVHHSGLASFLSDPGLDEEFETTSMRLDDILRAERVTSPRLVKIDVEGAEWLVVEGMAELLASKNRDMEVIVEIGPKRLARQGRRPEDIFRIFLSAGFHPYRIENDYSWRSYIPPRRITRPQRLHGPIPWETDVIFSRIHAETL